MYLLPSKLFCVTKLCYKYYDYITNSFTSIYTHNTLLTFLLLREHFNIWQFYRGALKNSLSQENTQKFGHLHCGKCFVKVDEF